MAIPVVSIVVAPKGALEVASCLDEPQYEDWKFELMLSTVSAPVVRPEAGL